MNITHALQEFGRRNGQSGLTLSAGGSVDLLIDGVPVTLHEHVDSVLMLTGFPSPFLDTERLIAILKACEQRAARPDEPPLQIGTRGQAGELWLIAGLRWPAATLSASQLDQGLQALSRFRRDGSQ